MHGIKKSLALLGAFSFGYNAAMALHECGHAFAMWAVGGSVTRITLHPFSKSFTFYGTWPTYPLLTSWAGVVFGCMCGLLLLILIRPWRVAWTLPLAMTSICALTVNGLYLTVDSLCPAGGDATAIILCGTSQAFILLIGLSLIVLGLISGYLLLPRFGLTADDSMASRIIVLETGVSPYLVVMLAYHLLWNQSEIAMWSAYVVAGLLALAAVAVGSRFIDKSPMSKHQYAPVLPSWSVAGGCLVAGTAIVGLELLFCTG